jgi:hypothetical protein
MTFFLEYYYRWNEVFYKNINNKLSIFDIHYNVFLENSLNVMFVDIWWKNNAITENTRIDDIIQNKYLLLYSTFWD